ncbi:hypothetical protein [Hydrogenophaga sp.]|uniref:hypothetical protein n=1 Tax=Hydrogenophaga sp. TaxID=1904254 RepID=UPI00273682C9|nr:hypothetical protein [Hydrogenophaga sp.]MDP3108097.1 hypothetical protein [Hydrogenophaga sp.]
MTTVTTKPTQSCEPEFTHQYSPERPLKCRPGFGLVHRIDVGIHTLATESLIIELRSMDAGELSTLYSWVGRAVDPTLVRNLIAVPQALEWRNVRRNNLHGGESYARQHTLYVHIYAPHEPHASEVTTHELVQRRFLDWLASDAAGLSIQA